MTAAFSELLAWVTGGSALAALSKVSLAVCALVLGLIYRRYLGILGADRSAQPSDKPTMRCEGTSLRGILRPGSTPNGSPGSSTGLTVSSATWAWLIERSSPTLLD